MSCQANSTELTFAREIQVQGINPCFGFDHLRSAVTSAIELTCSPVLPFAIRCHGVSSSACNGYNMPSSCLKCSQPQMLAVAKADSMPKLLQLVHFHSKSKSFVLQWLDLARLNLAQALKCAGIREAWSCPEVIARALDEAGHTYSRIGCTLLRSAPVVTYPVHVIHDVHNVQHVDTMGQGVQSSPGYGAKP